MGPLACLWFRCAHEYYHTFPLYPTVSDYAPAIEMEGVSVNLRYDQGQGHFGHSKCRGKENLHLCFFGKWNLLGIFCGGVESVG